jgi:hypothetical protein
MKPTITIMVVMATVIATIMACFFMQVLQFWINQGDLEAYYPATGIASTRI